MTGREFDCLMIGWLLGVLFMTIATWGSFRRSKQ